MSDGENRAWSSPGFYAPFVLGDLVLLIAAWLILRHAGQPLSAFAVGAFTFSVALGAVLSILPFVLRYRAELRLTEAAQLAASVQRIEQIQQVADHIAAATGQWQTVQEHTSKAVDSAKEIAERVGAEQREFRAFLAEANDAERQNLRIQVEKLRRSEQDYVEVVVRMLDHIYALFLAGKRSAQDNLIAQLTQFQNACRDVARKIGLTPLVAPPGTAYDPRHQQPVDPEAPVPEDAVVVETVATGFTYQGELLRLPVVTLRSSADDSLAEVRSAPPDSSEPDSPASSAESAA
jgi:molecular chaperone GrpE (heat shock protein)